MYSIPVVQSNFIIPEFTKYGVNSDFRIIGGSPVKVGEFPGQVSLVFYESFMSFLGNLKKMKKKSRKIASHA